jgi:hypothetical protein
VLVVFGRETFGREYGISKYVDACGHQSLEFLRLLEG